MIAEHLLVEQIQLVPNAERRKRDLRQSLLGSYSHFETKRLSQAGKASVIIQHFFDIGS